MKVCAYVKPSTKHKCVHRRLQSNLSLTPYNSVKGCIYFYFVSSLIIYSYYWYKNEKYILLKQFWLTLFSFLCLHTSSQERTQKDQKKRLLYESMCFKLRIWTKASKNQQSNVPLFDFGLLLQALTNGRQIKVTKNMW